MLKTKLFCLLELATHLIRLTCVSYNICQRARVKHAFDGTRKDQADFTVLSKTVVNGHTTPWSIKGCQP